MSPTTRDDAVLVLIADDERPIADVIALVVQDLGHRVQVARHGRDALELARTSWPALVITDLMMPELNGVALIEALRDEAARHGRPPVPVILMTAGDVKHTQDAGADAVLSKPFDLEELEQLVRRFLATPSADKLQAGI